MKIENSPLDKVWIVTASTLYKSSIVAVFSTKEAAKAHKESLSRPVFDGPNYEIEEHDVYIT